MALPTIFDICTPRPEIINDNQPDSDFAADLSQVLAGTAPASYQDPARFFANTHPTRGLQTLLEDVFTCLCSANESSRGKIFRLDTNYGGGKTHSLIALSHAAKGMRNVPNSQEFLKPELVPQTPIKVAAYDGQIGDSIAGLKLSGNNRAFTPWGELAYSLQGESGYNLIKTHDQEGAAPGSALIKELLGNEPTLILLDELSVYLRRAVLKNSTAADQLTAFLTALFKAVEESRNVALVFTLAVSHKDDLDRSANIKDAYSKENTAIAKAIDQIMQELKSVSARKADLLNPTAEDETILVLKRRLFENIDQEKSQEIVNKYIQLWNDHRNNLSMDSQSSKIRERFYGGYPFHPDIMDTFTEKTATLGDFQRVRGMLRILSRTIKRLWAEKPASAYAIHTHHIDLGYEPLRNEFTTRLHQEALLPALKADVAASDNDVPALAQQIDQEFFGGMIPYTRYLASTIFLHTLAYNELLRGLTQQQLNYSMLGPDLSLSLVDNALKNFRHHSAYLDDSPNPALRFMPEPNLNQIIAQQERHIDPDDITAHLKIKIPEIFKSASFFNVKEFVANASDVEDSDGTPQLVILGYEAAEVSGKQPVEVPDLVRKLYRYKDGSGGLRQNRNNLIFLVADAGNIEAMKQAMRTQLALQDLQNSAILKDLTDHQKNDLKARFAKSKNSTTITIQQTYRHIFYPGANNFADPQLRLCHACIDWPSASEKPGNGQNQLLLTLQGKLLRVSDGAANLAYTLSKIGSFAKSGTISTQELYKEYRQNPSLYILENKSVLQQNIKAAIAGGEFVYQDGELLAGKGDPLPLEIKIDDHVHLMTRHYAQSNGIWPKTAKEPAPEPVRPDNGPENSGTAPTTPTVEQPFKVEKEGTLKEALSSISDKMAYGSPRYLESLVINSCEFPNAFYLLNIINSIRCDNKFVVMDFGYQNTDQSEININFEGKPNSAIQLKDFAIAALRAAQYQDIRKIETTLTFSPKLSIPGPQWNDICSKLNRFEGTTVHVTATASYRPD